VLGSQRLEGRGTPRAVGANETTTVALARDVTLAGTHEERVGAVQAVTVGGAQDVMVAQASAVTVGAARGETSTTRFERGDHTCDRGG
jgi:hypothetical protein